jgi:hypothetical protein
MVKRGGEVLTGEEACRILEGLTLEMKEGDREIAVEFRRTAPESHELRYAAKVHLEY